MIWINENFYVSQLVKMLEILLKFNIFSSAMKKMRKSFESCFLSFIFIRLTCFLLKYSWKNFIVTLSEKRIWNLWNSVKCNRQTQNSIQSYWKQIKLLLNEFKSSVLSKKIILRSDLENLKWEMLKFDWNFKSWTMEIEIGSNSAYMLQMMIWHSDVKERENKDKFAVFKACMVSNIAQHIKYSIPQARPVQIAKSATFLTYPWDFGLEKNSWVRKNPENFATKMHRKISEIEKKIYFFFRLKWLNRLYK